MYTDRSTTPRDGTFTQSFSFSITSSFSFSITPRDGNVFQNLVSFTSNFGIKTAQTDRK